MELNGGFPTGDISNHQFGINSNVSNFIVERILFEDSDNGIFIKNNGTIGVTTIENNAIQNCGIGIIARNLERTQILIKANTFNQTPTCIDLYQVTDASVTVDNNFINYDNSSNPLPFTNTTTDYTYNGIRITNYVFGTANTCAVFNNYITNTQYGIHIRHVNHVAVSLNFLIFDIPHNGTESLTNFAGGLIYPLHSGIHIDNCSWTIVSENRIDRDRNICDCRDLAEDELMRGIEFTRSQVNNSIVLNPSISYMTNAILFRNSCLGTVVRCNQFIQNSSGVSIGKLNPLIIAEISSQNGFAHEDEWHTVAFIVDQTKRVTERNNNVHPILWTYSSALGSTIANPEYPAANHTYGSVIPTPNFSNGCAPPEQGTPEEEEERASLLWDIVNDTDEHIQYPVEFAYYADNFAYRFLATNPDYLTLNNDNDAPYAAYYETMQQSNIGKFYQIQLYMDGGDYEAAIELTTSIEPSNTIEENKKVCLLIFMSTYAINEELNADQIDQLTAIAYQYSVTGGEGVHWARAMLHIEVDENGGGSRHAATNNGKEVAKNNIIKNVYPNPAGNYLFVETENVNDVTISITDITGKIARTQKLVNGKNKLNLKGLNPGIYLYYITSGFENIKNDKLIIN